MGIIKKIMGNIYWNGLGSILRIFPLKENQIFFESFLGEVVSDNPGSVYQYMINNNLEYKYVWSLKNVSKAKDVKIDKKTKVIKKTSIKYLYYLYTSKYIINNSRMPIKFKKKSKQIYIQTWHGTPLKQLVHDMQEVHLPNVSTQKYKLDFDIDIKKWDYLVIPNKYSEEKFKSAFAYQGNLLKTGYPRNDELKKHMNDLDGKEKKKRINDIKKKLNLDAGKKILLYTPTFRDDEYTEKGKYIQKINFDLNKIIKDNPDLIILFKCHYLVKKIVNNYGDFNGNCINLSHYSPINDLYLISDILMTDYSSTFFDYSILKKPIILYQYDYQKYKNVLRDFYLEIDELPVKPIYEKEELYEEINIIIKGIKTNEEFKYQKEFSELQLEEYSINSSENLIKKIFNTKKGEK